MKIVLMGAGYVGISLLESLKDSHHEIIITTTTKEKVEFLKSYGKEVFFLDSEDLAPFDLLIKNCEALIVLVAPKNSEAYKETYFDTAKKIVSSLKNRKKPLYILYTSSTSVYENAGCQIVLETTPLCPLSDNGKILIETEKLYLNSEADLCVLRLGGIYGPKREFLNRAKRFSSTLMGGTGDEPTNSIHLNDIVAAITFCLDNHVTGVYNLVNDDHPTRKVLYENLCRSIKIPPPLWNRDEPSTKKNSSIVSNKKIKEKGFIFKESL